LTALVGIGAKKTGYSQRTFRIEDLNREAAAGNREGGTLRGMTTEKRLQKNGATEERTASERSKRQRQNLIEPRLKSSRTLKYSANFAESSVAEVTINFRSGLHPDFDKEQRR